MECYLDNSATTKPCKAAVDAEISALTELYGNPSSLHQKGVDAYMLLEKSRGTIAASLKASPDEIYFTPCGTVSNNTAIFGAVNAKKRLGKKIVTTALEHPSVEKCMERLEESGFEVVRVQPQSDGNISLKDFENAIDENTILVSVMAVNNEVGSVMPAENLKKIIKSKNSPALLHVDDVQGYMKIPLCPKSCGIDLMSVSAHKVHGPKGVGALYINKNVRINPYILGGGQHVYQLEVLVYHADSGVDGVLRGAEHYVFPAYLDLAAVRGVDTAEHVYQRALTGAVLTEQREYLALADVDGNVLVRLHRAEALADVF